jgi:hypothetical protein
MGYARDSASDWAAYASRTSKRSRHEIFAARALHRSLDPKGAIRESRDSALNPDSRAIIVAGDVTGSMGFIAEALIKRGIGLAFQEILARSQPGPDGAAATMFSDPHMMLMAVGDAWCDRAPLQVTQFEADSTTLASQVEKVFLEGGGGGNAFESYNLPWWFAGMHTRLDCVEKRGRKGYLFTVGDEPPPPTLDRAHARAIFGDDLQQDLASRDVLTVAERLYHVFHIVVEEGSHPRHAGLDSVMRPWRDLLGQRVLRLADHSKLAEVIVSAIQVTEGMDHDAVARTWSGETALVVARAVSGLTATGHAAPRGFLRFSGR